MREFMKLFEDDAAVAAEDDRLSAVYARERHVEALIREVCDHDASIDLSDNPRSISYSEEDNRSARILAAGPVTFAQLQSLGVLGGDIVVDSVFGDGIEIRMVIHPNLAEK